MHPEPKSRLTCSVAEAAAQLGVSVRSIRYLIATGRLAHVRLGRRVLIRSVDLEQLVRQGYVKSVARLDADEPIRPSAGHEKHT